jgi:ubiquinone/menaquinone biosynthesis C-methylase UbiE
MNISDANLRGMKEDWNARARQNARWFINTVHDRQAEHEFDQTGRTEVQNLVCADLLLLTHGRDPHNLRLLEIGCGVGRMTRPLAEIFGEVYATDVSGEMIVRGQRRLRDCKNVIFSETNGIDFHLFADRFFDIIFCAYVYQHVPTADVIRANLTDAYRVLKPGGVFKFQTNGVTNEIFRGLPKDTWMGEAFDEHAIRSLARELDAQMISISGAGSQYCWTVWRRRMMDADQADVPLSSPVPIIDFTARRRQSLVMAGLDPNSADINNVIVQLGETSSIEPCYVGPIIDREAPISYLRVDFTIPATEPTGLRTISIRLKNGSKSPSILLEVTQPMAVVPSIVFITNGKDGGLDIESTGPKSRVRLFVEGITAWPNWEQLEVLLGQMHIHPDKIDFVPGNGLYMVEFTMPEISPETIPVALVLGDRRSASTNLLVRRETFGARLRRLATGSSMLRVIKRVKMWSRTRMLEIK